MKKNGKRKCPECQGPMALGRTTLHFERGAFYADVENVSAYLCSHCGSRSIPGPIAAQVSATVNSLFKSVRRVEGPSPFSGISFHEAAASPA